LFPYTTLFRSLFDHSFKRRRNWHIVPRCQEHCVQEKIQRIDVVIHGLLKVQTISAYLPVGLLQHNLPAHPPPSFSLRQFRTECPDEKQRHSFTQQVRVRRKERGEIALDVATADSERIS